MRDLTKAALGAAGVALAAITAGQLMPDAPGQQTCVVAWALGPCDVSLALGGEDTCVSGALVTRPVEIPLPDEDTEGPALPAGFNGLGVLKQVPCVSLDHKEKALHVSSMRKHGVLHANGVYCPPVVVLGHEPEGCDGPVAPAEAPPLEAP